MDIKEERTIFYISKVFGLEIFLTEDKWFFNLSLLLEDKVETFLKKIESDVYSKEGDSYFALLEILPYALSEFGYENLSKSEVIKELLDNITYEVYETLSYCGHSKVSVRKIKNTHIQSYLVRSFNNYYKIGKTNNIRKRLKQLETSNPEIELVGVSDEFSEEFLHKKFKKYRVKGEWFIFDDSIINEVKQYFYI